MTIIPAYIKKLDAIRKKVTAVKSKQVQSSKLRGEIRSLIEDYFKSIRPSIISDAEKNFEIGKIDSEMQELFVLCHKIGVKSGYSTKIISIRNHLISLDSKILLPTTPITAKESSIDTHIIDTLNKILPSAALSYKQAISDLKEETRYSWRGPATDLRESLRETLDHLAPDNMVTAMQGYKQENGTNGPTMKQKVRFILSSRGISKTQSSTAENAADSIENMVGAFVRSVYTRSSISTHTPTEKTEVIRIKNFVRATLCELLEIQI